MNRPNDDADDADDIFIFFSYAPTLMLIAFAAAFCCFLSAATFCFFAALRFDIFIIYAIDAMLMPLYFRCRRQLQLPAAFSFASVSSSTLHALPLSFRRFFAVALRCR